MQRWIRAHIMLLDTKVHSAVLDKTSNAAKEILKCLIEIAERSPPRSAENIALVKCILFPIFLTSSVTSRHSPYLTMLLNQLASKFLLSWLFQHEHEYRQWSAAISLGLISSFLHVTDRKQKVEYINALLEVESLLACLLCYFVLITYNLRIIEFL
nr:protein RST1 isoform X3 [Ipomoea batatas]